MHILVARSGDGWGAWRQEARGLDWSPVAGSSNRLEPVVDEALDHAFRTKPPADLTFSTKQVDDVTAHLVLGGPVKVDLGAQVDALMPEGRFDGDDRWGVVQRQARTGYVWSMGLASAFRERTLKDRIRKWFEDQDWRSFGPPNPRYPNSRPPPWERELYVRHGEAWRARQLAANDFPAFKPGPIITPEQQARQLARMPQARSAVRRAKHQANAERFKAEAAERAKLRGEA